MGGTIMKMDWVIIVVCSVRCCIGFTNMIGLILGILMLNTGGSFGPKWINGILFVILLGLFFFYNIGRIILQIIYTIKMRKHNRNMYQLRLWINTIPMVSKMKPNGNQQKTNDDDKE